MEVGRTAGERDRTWESKYAGVLSKKIEKAGTLLHSELATP